MTSYNLPDPEDSEELSDETSTGETQDPRPEGISEEDFSKDSNADSTDVAEAENTDNQPPGDPNDG